MKTYENNMADQALVVKSLKVLDKIEGGGVTEIKNDVEAVRRQTVAQNKKQEEFWKQFSDDGVISVIEKQSLYRESQNIDRSYAAITQQATALQIESSIMADYIATYNALHTYLYTTLKLFDDMSSETVIDDRDTFNGYFSGYYFDENFVLLAITAGILDSIDFRVLQSLTEPGTEGETAIYRGGLYQYINGAWKNVSTGAYKGPRTELPPDEEGAFFIVSEAFTLTQGLIVNGEELYVNGDLLGVVSTYLKGYIYYYEDGTWHPVFDKTDWRYAAAFADVINITGELPQIFQDAIDDLQEQIDTKASAASLAEEIETREGQYTIIAGDIVEINGDITNIIARADAQAATISDQQTQINGKISHLPVYLGPATSTSYLSPQVGDYYLHTGSGADYLKIKRYDGGNTWYTLDPSNSTWKNYYMMALEDILAAEHAGSGAFTKLFCQAFWTASADVDTLDVKTIYLRQYGKIQSANATYVRESVGCLFNADGDIDANGDTHIAGKVAIGVSLKNSQGQYQPDFSNYNTVIGGNVKIKGQTDVDSSMNLKGVVTAANLSLSGFKAGDIVLRELPWFSPSDEKIKKFYAQICGTGEFRLTFDMAIVKVQDGHHIIYFESKSIDVGVNEGEYVSFYGWPNQSVAQTYIMSGFEFKVADRQIYRFQSTGENYLNLVSQVKIKTDGANGILAYLGQSGESSSEPPHPR
jgi:hypothetical protein